MLEEIEVLKDHPDFSTFATHFAVGEFVETALLLLVSNELAMHV
jgi:hypothetical protein